MKISSPICEFTFNNISDIQHPFRILTCNSYDGEADDPAPPVKAPEPEVKPEPEPAPASQDSELQQEETQDEDVTFKTEQDQPMQDLKQEQSARDDDYDRPLQIKEDG